MWVWLKLKLTPKGDFCEVSVTNLFVCFFFFAKFTMLKLYYLRVPTSLLTGCDTKVALDSGLSLGA